MNKIYLIKLFRKNFLFWLSRMVDYPFLPPDFVQLNFTFNCNLRCKMCRMYEQKQIALKEGRQVEIDSETLKKIIQQASAWGAKNILFIGGEPLLRKDLFELVEFTAKRNINPIIVTNGVLLDEAKIKKCLESKVGWLSISIDAATEQTFSKIRGENILPAIIKNVKLLVSLKKESHADYPRLISVCTIMNDNLEELIKVVELCKSLGMEKVFFQPVVANNTDQTERKADAAGFIPSDRLGLLDEALDTLIKYKNKSPENFDFILNNAKSLLLIKRYFRGIIKPKESPCYAGYNRFQVVQEGKAYFCVNQQKYIAVFGDIKKDSLKELWFSPRARFYRRLIRKCQTPCLQGCSYSDDRVILSELFQKRRLFKSAPG